MVDFIKHGDGSVTVVPSEGQTGGTAFDVAGTYKSEEEASRAVESGVRTGDDVGTKTLSKFNRLTPEEGLILGRQPIGEPAYGSQLYYRTKMLKSPTAQWSSEREFEQKASQVAPYLRSGTELRGSIVEGSESLPAGRHALPTDELYINRYVKPPKPQAEKEYYGVTYPRGFGSINVAHEYDPNIEFKALGFIPQGRPKPGKQYRSDILGFTREYGDINQTEVRQQRAETYSQLPLQTRRYKYPTISVPELKVSQALNMALFSPFLIKSPYMATLSKSKDPWAKIPTMRQSAGIKGESLSRTIRDMGSEIRASQTAYPAGKKQVAITIQQEKVYKPYLAGRYRTPGINKYKVQSITKLIPKATQTYKSLTIPVSAMISKQFQLSKQRDIQIPTSLQVPRQASAYRQVSMQTQVPIQISPQISVSKQISALKSIQSEYSPSKSRSRSVSKSIYVPKIKVPVLPKLSVSTDFGMSKKELKRLSASWEVKNPFLSLSDVTGTGKKRKKGKKK